jgi:hypothetical protein
MREVEQIFRIIEGYKQNWPDNEWFSVSDHLDLQLFTEDGEQKAMLYDVVGEEIKTDYWVELKV